MPKPSEQQYEIHIGEITEFPSMNVVPAQKIIISHDQFEVIKTFANTRKDKDLNTIYTLNDCDFKVLAVIDLTT